MPPPAQTVDSPRPTLVPEPPPLPAYNRAVITGHIVIMVLAVASYIVTGTVTGAWSPQPWPTLFMGTYLLGLAGLIGYSVWRGVTGRAHVDPKSLGAIKSDCARQAAHHHARAAAVAMHPSLPHPFTGHVYAAVTAEPAGSSAPGTSDVSVHTTPGWALLRTTAWRRGLILAGYAPDHAEAASEQGVGAVEHPDATHRTLTGNQRPGRHPRRIGLATGHSNR